MRVFISWSGPLSKQTAENLREILPCMLQGLDIFLSQHDIESGSRWGHQLAPALQESSFGIVCLTPANQTSPWLLFEAGALTKHMEGRACGLLLGGLRAAEVSGPLAQFQHREFSRTGMLSLIADINSKSDSPLKDTQVKLVFDKWWPDLEATYNTHAKGAKEVVSAPRRGDRDILEEILVTVRELKPPVGEGVPEAEPEIERVPVAGSAMYLAKIIEKAMSFLTPSQRTLLIGIATGKRLGDPRLVAKTIEKATSADIDALLACGFVTRNPQGEIRMHKILGEYLHKRAPANTT